MSETSIIQATKNWVDTVVIGLNLCPFAKREVNRGAVHYSLSKAKSEEHLLHDLESELNRLTQKDDIATTLLVHPHVLSDFLDYNQFLESVDDLIVNLKLEGIYPNRAETI